MSVDRQASERKFYKKTLNEAGNQVKQKKRRKKKVKSEYAWTLLFQSTEEHRVKWKETLWMKLPYDTSDTKSEGKRSTYHLRLYLWHKIVHMLYLWWWSLRGCRDKPHKQKKYNDSGHAQRERLFFLSYEREMKRTKWPVLTWCKSCSNFLESAEY